MKMGLPRTLFSHQIASRSFTPPNSHLRLSGVLYREETPFARSFRSDERKMGFEAEGSGRRRVVQDRPSRRTCQTDHLEDGQRAPRAARAALSGNLSQGPAKQVVEDLIEMLFSRHLRRRRCPRCGHHGRIEAVPSDLRSPILAQIIPLKILLVLVVPPTNRQPRRPAPGCPPELSSTITTTAPASSAIFPCSTFTTSIMTLPLSI
jgi:hypothetical protein